MKRLIAGVLLALVMSSSTSFAQVGKEITVYDPDTALHPIRLISLFARPPIALLNTFVRGGYYVLDSDPIRRGFDIDTKSGLSLDEDY
ncbi:MAG: hypothetical protein QXX77_06165 [Candidatus Methanosuratincola sp.]